MNTQTDGAVRVTLARLQVGDWVRTTLATHGDGKVYRTPVKHDEPGVEVRQVREIERQVTPSVNGSPHVVEYVVTFDDGSASEPRYGSTSYYRTEAPVVAPVLKTDPATHRTDAEIDAALDGEPVEDDGERCGTCKGFGLVRGVGKRAGERYKTLAGAQFAQGEGRAQDCPDCKGLGEVLLEAAKASGHLEIITVGR